MDNIFTVTHRHHSLSYFNMTVSLFNRSETPFEYRFTPFILFVSCCHTCMDPARQYFSETQGTYITGRGDKTETIHLRRLHSLGPRPSSRDRVGKQEGGSKRRRRSNYLKEDLVHVAIIIILCHLYYRLAVRLVRF